MNKPINLPAKENFGLRIGIALIFLSIGALIMVVFSPWSPVLSRVNDYLGRAVLIFMLLLVLLLVKRFRQHELYQPILLGLFIMIIVVPYA